MTSSSKRQSRAYGRLACPSCRSLDTRVVKARGTPRHDVVHRLHRCQSCRQTFRSKQYPHLSKKCPLVDNAM